MAEYEPHFTEYYNAVGVSEERGSVIKECLERRLAKVLDKFPFSSEETTDLPILSFDYQKPHITVPGLDFEVKPEVVEKIMDSVIIANSRFEGLYSFGPIKKNWERNSDDLEKRRVYKTMEFPVSLPGGRQYIVTKGMETVDFLNEQGKLEEEMRLSINYFASLSEDEVITQLANDSDSFAS